LEAHRQAEALLRAIAAALRAAHASAQVSPLAADAVNVEWNGHTNHIVRNRLWLRKTGDHQRFLGSLTDATAAALAADAAGRLEAVGDRVDTAHDIAEYHHVLVAKLEGERGLRPNDDAHYYKLNFAPDTAVSDLLSKVVGGIRLLEPRPHNLARALELAGLRNSQDNAVEFGAARVQPCARARAPRARRLLA
jgi:hypothetical protein